MTLKEAIESGKRFSRPGFDRIGSEYARTQNWTSEQILATDWEIEEEKVTVTQQQVCNALGKAIQGNCQFEFSQFMRDLGFK